MSNFTVKYRGSDGALKTEVISAGSRADALAQMKARGATPISVTEGGKIAAAVSSSTAKPVWLKGAIAGVVVVVAAVVAFICLTPSGKPAEQKVEKPKKVKVEKPKPTAHPVSKSPQRNLPSTVTPVASTNVAVPVVDSSKRYHKGVEVVSSQARTNKNGVVVEKLQLADGKTIERVRHPKPVFDSPSDQLIALALTARAGQSMPPLPGLGSVDRDFAASLATPITISPDDSPDVKELKLKVKEARAYIAAEVGSGRTVRQCLEEHCQRMDQIADDHQMALEQIARMRKEGASAKDVADFRERVNELFREKGTPELPVVRRDGPGHPRSNSTGDGQSDSQSGVEQGVQP